MARLCMDVQPPRMEVHEDKVHTHEHADSRAKQPGNNINLYMGLLKEELDTLWKTPAWTWDASKGEYFYMRAALMTTVHDYLGYGYTSGQVCHGYCGCTRFMDDTMSQQLTSTKDGRSGKIVYMGHRRWLEKDDPWRKCGDLFNGLA